MCFLENLRLLCLILLRAEIKFGNRNFSGEISIFSSRFFVKSTYRRSIFRDQSKNILSLNFELFRTWRMFLLRNNMVSSQFFFRKQVSSKNSEKSERTHFLSIILYGVDRIKQSVRIIKGNFLNRKSFLEKFQEFIF